MRVETGDGEIVTCVTRDLSESLVSGSARDQATLKSVNSNRSPRKNFH